MYRNNLVQKIRKQFGLKPEDDKLSKGAVITRWKRRPTSVPPATHPSTPPAPTSAPGVALIEHVLNDSTTSDLVSNVNAPVVESVNSFAVKGFKGGGVGRGTAEYQAANVYVTIGETINSYNNNSVDKKIPHWRRTNILMVYPRAGVDLNAYYDGQSLKFFFYTDGRIGTVFAADSTDIVSHECGHGILDCFRPDLWSAAYLETGAFHEFFGDFSALMHAFGHDEMINRALSETNNDLSKSNVISRLAEQFGKAIYTLDPNGRSPDYLRNAVNTFKYVDPSSLPSDSPDNELAAEVHNFSRIMTGAVYDIFVAIFNDKKNNLYPLDAAKQTRDLICHYMLLAIENAPLNSKFFASVANTLIWADSQISAGKYGSIMKYVFVNRNILSEQVQMLSATKSPNSSNIVKTKKLMNIKLSDVTVRALGHDDNPLYDVLLEIPVDEAHLFDHHGTLHCHITDTEDEAIRSAQDFVHHLHKTGGVGPDQKTPWEVREGRLVRTRTCCKF